MTQQDDVRVCKTCGVEKPINEFHIEGNHIRSTCRICRNTKRLALRDEPGAKEREHANRVKWYHEAGGKEITRKNCNTFRRRTGYKGWSDKDARIARLAVQTAIRNGTLARRPCEVCGEEKTHAHHDDYNYPLSVRWLCQPCHTEWHRHNEPIRVGGGNSNAA